jgi:DNA-binding beta-propeller fold protein YncE
MIHSMLGETCKGSLRLIGGTAVVALALAACHVPRHAQKTTQASPSILTPPLHSAAPPAAGPIGGLRGPESVLYDPQQDVYFISNINGGLLAADDNGFISRVHPDSLAVELKWIEAEKNGVTLDGPKGMAIVGETLYVADVKAVRKFDRRTGRPQGAITLPGATLINDLTTDGRSVYVSDTGVRPGPGITFQATGTDAIWKIDRERAERIAAGAELRQPNGLDFVGGTLRVVTFAGDELYTLDGGRRKTLAHLPAGQLDGIVQLPDGRVAITSWLGKEILVGAPAGPFEAILAGVSAPADIGYDSKRHRLLLPSSTANQVTIHEVR